MAWTGGAFGMEPERAHQQRDRGRRGTTGERPGERPPISKQQFAGVKPVKDDKDSKASA